MCANEQLLEFGETGVSDPYEQFLATMLLDLHFSHIEFLLSWNEAMWQNELLQFELAKQLALFRRGYKPIVYCQKIARQLFQVLLVRLKVRKMVEEVREPLWAACGSKDGWTSQLSQLLGMIRPDLVESSSEKIFAWLGQGLKNQRGDFIEVFLSCVVSTPMKQGVYARLFSHINARDEEIGRKFIEKLGVEISTLIETRKWQKLIDMVRFLCLLSVNGTVTPDSILDSANNFIDGANFWMHNSPQRANTFGRAVIAAISTLGRRMYCDNPVKLQSLMKRVEEYTQEAAKIRGTFDSKLSDDAFDHQQLLREWKHLQALQHEGWSSLNFYETLILDGADSHEMPNIMQAILNSTDQQDPQDLVQGHRIERLLSYIGLSASTPGTRSQKDLVLVSAFSLGIFVGYCCGKAADSMFKDTMFEIACTCLGFAFLLLIPCLFLFRLFCFSKRDC
ncbi:unnamed protein product, partial [Mesorhabditis spiculigera]